MKQLIKAWWSQFTGPEYHLMHPDHGSLFDSKERSVVEAKQANMGADGLECTIMMSI